MSRNVIETVMGGVVLLVAGGFLTFAFNNSSLQSVDGYHVAALFDNVSGVGAGTDVQIGGIKVGVVESVGLDSETYRARLDLQIMKNIKLPKDSTASIASSGLLGGKFVKLEPGGDEAMLDDGDAITFTQSSVNLEELIGKFVFSGGGVEDDDVMNDDELSLDLE